MPGNSGTLGKEKWPVQQSTKSKSSLVCSPVAVLRETTVNLRCASSNAHCVTTELQRTHGAIPAFSTRPVMYSCSTSRGG
jgi:hypothetical protein